MVGGQPVAHLHVDDEVALVRPRRDLAGEPDVALRVRRVLEQLPVVVAVALGRLDLGRALEVEHPLVDAGVRLESPGRADRQDEVVARSVGDRPEDRVEQARALVDEQHLVRLAVAVEDAVRHRRRRADDTHHDVVVEEQRDAAGDGVAVRRDARRIDEAVVVIAVVGLLERGSSRDRLDLVGPRRRDEVVEQRRATREPLDPEQLLGVERAVGRAMLGVARVRDVAARRRRT